MKKILLLIVVFSLHFALNAQISYFSGPNVYTCKNGLIETVVPNRELNSQELASIDYALFNSNGDLYYLQIKRSDIISDPTSRYNCHAYAWHLKEGNNNQVWINRGSNDSNLKKYWDMNVGCFIETTSEAEAEKIYYYTGDHSAVKSLVVGKYESKWGQLHVIRHLPNQVPYPSPSNRRYYKKGSLPYSISGPTTICTQATYTIENLPTGASVQWSLSNDNLIFGEYSGRNNIDFIKNGNGYCDITASISIPGNNEPIILRKTAWGGPPRTYIKEITGGTGEIPEIPDNNTPNNSGTIRVYPNQYAHVKFDADGLLGDTQWIADLPQTDVCQFANFGSSITILGRKPGMTVFSTKATSDCGEGTPSLIVVNVVANPAYFSVSPNPAYTTATVKLSDEMFPKNDMLNYEIQVWSSTALIDTYQANDPTYQISVSHLPAGIYFVHVIKDGEIYREKLIVK